MRICDAQSTAEASTALAGLITACVAQAAPDHDEEVPLEPPAGRLVEENFWRAIRHGLDGKLIDLDRQEEYPAAAIGDRLLAWTAPARSALGHRAWRFRRESGAQRQRRAMQAGASIEEVYRAEVAETQRTYAGERRSGERPAVPRQPSEEQLREALAQLRVEDVVLHTAVTLVNLAGRRLTVPEEKDLDPGPEGPSRRFAPSFRSVPRRRPRRSGTRSPSSR